MKKQIFILTIILLVSGFVAKAQNFYQSNCTTNEILNNSQNSNISLKVEKVVDCEIIGTTTGFSQGIRIVPLLPFLKPNWTPSLVQLPASQIEAEQDALKKVGGDLLLDEKVEKQFTGVLFIFYIEKVTVSGIAAKIKK